MSVSGVSIKSHQNSWGSQRVGTSDFSNPWPLEEKMVTELKVAGHVGVEKLFGDYISVCTLQSPLKELTEPSIVSPETETQCL